MVKKDLVIYTIMNEKIIRIAEGDGSNLTPEDEADGFVDYLYYDIFDAQDFQDVEDGGMVLLEKPIQEEFNDIHKVVCRVLDMAFGNEAIAYTILSGEEDWAEYVGEG